MSVSYECINAQDLIELRKRPLKVRLFGQHLQHSKAPLLQNYIFDRLGLKWRYELFASDDFTEFKRFLGSENCAGAAVTMPNKVKILEHIDIVDDGAKAVRSVNTIYLRKQLGSERIVYVGTNTDTLGIRDSFTYNAPKYVQRSQSENRPGLVYGGGGACRSAVYALSEFFKCPTIYVVNRFAHEVVAVSRAMAEGGFLGKIVHIKDEEEAHSIQNKPLLVVSTIPDFTPQTAEEKKARAILDIFMSSEKGAALEMCYHPKPTTRIYNDFKASGWKVISGVEAMIYQGIAQQVLWTGYELEDIPISDIIEHVYSDLD
ncbi:uncharacterized protein RJT20DRAFT_48455 [Scheffersomyces xylosifermentans]|uniref:uncharacterized protein n=1 Tax=Scheffersomyces xylosifermentans TaxID=1304137 RepID=UPI00315DC2AE